MARMVRKQIVMDAEQERALAQCAASRGVSQSELVRQAVGHMLSEAAAETRRERAWEETLAGIEAARQAGVGSRGQKWTREELHER
jgi:hypothetical protein